MTVPSGADPGDSGGSCREQPVAAGNSQATPPIIVQLARSEPPDHTAKGPWGRFIEAMPLIQAVALAFIGFWLTDSVTSAIQKRQLELNNVTEMQSLLAKVYDRKASMEDMTSSVAALTAFREYAIPPLTNLLLSNDPIKRTAAELGFRTLSLSDSTAVRDQLLRIVASRNRVCSWQMLQSAVRMIGDLALRDALPSLRDLSRRLENKDPRAAADALAEVTNRDATPDTSSVLQLKDDIAQVIARLQPAAGAAP